MLKIRHVVTVLGTMLCSAASFAQVSIGINLPAYPEFVPVPGYPAYYAPQLNANHFFMTACTWVYQDDNRYESRLAQRSLVGRESGGCAGVHSENSGALLPAAGLPITFTGSDPMRRRVGVIAGAGIRSSARMRIAGVIRAARRPWQPERA
ncbi:MAG: hypothetical protein K2P57_02415 [Burkholderiales bacterium]|nr:hypothetical protein [Burkholderiales bacterium]